LRTDAVKSGERLPVVAAAALPDCREVIKEIMHAAPDGIFLRELPQKFEVST